MDLKASSELHERVHVTTEHWEQMREVEQPASFPDPDQTVEAWNEHAQSPTLEQVPPRIPFFDYPESESDQLLLDHPDLHARLARFERGGSLGRPLTEVMKELDPDA